MQIFSNVAQDEADMIREEAKKYVKGPIPGEPRAHCDKDISRTLYLQFDK
jgi:hypothetical protein